MLEANPAKIQAHYDYTSNISKTTSSLILDSSGPQSNSLSSYSPLQSKFESVLFAFIFQNETPFLFACIAGMEVIVIYTELLSIGELAPFKFLVFEIFYRCRPCFFQVFKLLLNWWHVYEEEQIPGIAEIKGGIKDFLQHFTTAAATSTYHM